MGAVIGSRNDIRHLGRQLGRQLGNVMDAGHSNSGTTRWRMGIW